jgi:uncharacterized RDD family membrane protein YckC
MDQQLNNFDSKKSNPNNSMMVNLDDFNISEDSFKPVNKGLGFHQDEKRRTSFKSTPKEVTTFKKALNTPKALSNNSLISELTTINKETSLKQSPSGLEAFYGTTPTQANSLTDKEIENVLDSKIFSTENNFELAKSSKQLAAWTIDLLVLLSFSLITTALLILVSGMSFNSFLQVVPLVDLITFGTVLFSLYYLMYFTVLDLTGSPGKTIMGIRLLKLDNKEVTVKNTFTRAVVSLLSFIALFLPMVIDFQGRLSDTKTVNA